MTYLYTCDILRKQKSERENMKSMKLYRFRFLVNRIAGLLGASIALNGRPEFTALARQELNRYNVQTFDLSDGLRLN